MKCGVLAIGLLVFLATSALAQVSIRTQVDGDRFFVGESFTFYLVVDGEDPVKDPEFRASDDLSVRLTGSHATELDGGLVTTYTYRGVPLRGGDIEIPGALVTVAGGVYSGPPETVTVAVPEGTSALKLRMELSKDTCFVGEPVVLTFSWESELSLSGMRAVDIRLPVLADPRFDVFEPLDAVDPASSDAIGLPVSHSRTIARLATGDRTDGERGDPARLVFRKVIVPQEPGDLVLDVATLVCSYLKPTDKKFGGFRYPSYFNNDFFDQTVKGDYERYLVSSNEVSLRVMELPKQGRPTNFDGIVGAVEMDTDVAPKVAKVDDPMNLTVSIRNHPFPQTLRLPSLNQQESLTYSFSVSEYTGGSTIRGGVAIFRRLIRPERPNIPAVPALRLSYFDPVTGRYGEAQSAPLPVRITRAESVNAFDAVFANGERLRNSIRTQDGGIFQNFSVATVLSGKKTRSGWFQRGGFWLIVVFFPPLAFVSVLLISQQWRLERRDAKAARAKRAYARFRSGLRVLDVGDTDEDSVFRLKRVVQRYFGDRFGLAPEAVEGEDIRRLLGARGMDPKLGAGVAEFWERSDARTYSPSSMNGDGLEAICRALPELIGRVERGLEA
ncbi:MAG: BatD family protein [Verrucomicrobiota bacterium]